MDQQQPQAVQHQMAGSQSCLSFMPLDLERRIHVDTACAAYHLERKPQTCGYGRPPKMDLCDRFG